MQELLKVSTRWMIYERPMGSVDTPWNLIHVTKNIITNDGLSALASVWIGAASPPLYLVIDNGGTLMHSTASIGSSSVSLNAAVDQVGDTQLVLSPGLANQETVTFSSRTGTGPYTYNLSAVTTKIHSVGEKALRNVSVSDTMSSVTSEVQYDSVDFPGQRTMSAGGGKVSDGVFTTQFYLTGLQALTALNTLGISDNINVGQGLLHNHFVLGLDHNSGTDILITGTLTIANA